MYNSRVEKLIKRDEQIVSAQLSNGQTMRYNDTITLKIVLPFCISRFVHTVILIYKKTAEEFLKCCLTIFHWVLPQIILIIFNSMKDIIYKFAPQLYEAVG